jgi:hypothetical protein
MTSRNQILLILLVFVASACNSSSHREATDLTKTGVIPRPVSITASGDKFIVKDNTVIFIQAGNADTEKIANYLAGR